MNYVASERYGEPSDDLDPAWEAAHRIIERDLTKACQFAADALSWAFDHHELAAYQVAIDYVEDILIDYGARAIDPLVSIVADDRVRVLFCELYVPKRLQAEWSQRLNCGRTETDQGPSA